MTGPTLKVKVVRKPTLKLKVLPRFPANVAVGNFLTVANSGGTYTFGVDYTLLSNAPIISPSTALVVVFDQSAGIYKLQSVSNLATDLPTNSVSYGQIQQVGANKLLGNPTGSTANVSEVSIGTGVATALGVNVGSAGAVVVNGGSLGTPASGTLTNATGLPVSSGISGLGTGVAAFLATPSSANLRAALTDEVGTGAAYFVGGALGTPASGTLTSCTGLPLSTGVSGAGTGVLSALAVNVGSAGAPVINGGVLGTPSSGTATNLTGLPIATGVSGLGTGVATALAVNVGTAGSPVVNGGALGTPSSGTLTNATGLPLSGLATEAAFSFVGNNTSGSASPTAVTIGGLTAKASPAASDLVMISDQAASGAWKQVTVSSLASAGSVSSIAGNTGAFTLGVGLTHSVNDIQARRPKVITFTFDISLTTNFSITGVGFAPRAAIFFVAVPAGVGQFAFGMTDGTTSEEIQGRGSIAADTMGIDTTCFDVIVGSGSSNTVALVSLDSDGFTFSRTKTGSPTGTATVQAFCFS